MKQSVNFSAFTEAFRSHGREGQFTDAGLLILFDHLVGEEAMSGTERELDVVELCGTYTEYTPAEAVSYYGLTAEDLGIEVALDELREAVVEERLGAVNEQMDDDLQAAVREQYEQEALGLGLAALAEEDAGMVKMALIDYFTRKAQVINVPHGETFIIANY